MPLPRKEGAVATLPRLDDLEVTARRVLVRADLNVPLEGGHITDDFRIRAFLPTLARLLERGGRAVVCSHLGRPKGPDPRLSLQPVAAALEALLGVPVPLAGVDDPRPNTDVVLLENLRFDAGETSNDPSFVDRLCAGAEAYVNDAFGACHRAHASIVGPPSRLPAAAGLLLAREVDELSRLLEGAERPFVVVLGGAKVADKIGVVRNLLDRADEILVGGGMCFTFLRAKGGEVGKSIVDVHRLDEAREVVRSPRLVLPVDVVCAPDASAKEGTVVPADRIPPGLAGLDIGPETAGRFAAAVRGAATVFWNGPMGVFERPPFDKGTREVAAAVADCAGHTVTGGGDTQAALAAFGLEGRVDFASTGGGASLEFLEGKELPGIAALLGQR